MPLDQQANFVRDTVVDSIGAGDDSITVRNGSIFPDPDEGKYQLIVWDAEEHPRPDQDPDVEIVRATAIDGDEISVARGQERTDAVEHPATAAIQLSQTAKLYSDIESQLASVDKMVFGMYPDQLDAEERQEIYEEQLDTVVASDSAMRTIARYELVMDEVSTSEVAMDAVSTSEVAMDAVLASEVAMDAVLASEVAMDAVSTSEVAMDAVSTSTTAMEAAVGSVLPRTAMLVSEHVLDTMWESEMASEVFFESGLEPRTENPISGFPQHVDGVGVNGYPDGDEYIRATTETPSGHGGQALEIRGREGDSANTDNIYWIVRADLSDADELSVWNFDYTGGDNGGLVGLFEVNDVSDSGYESLDSSASNSSWTQLTYDISSFTGEYFIALGTNNDDARPGRGNDNWEDGDVFYGLELN